MAKLVPITVLQNNDRTLEFDLDTTDSAFTLAGKTIEFFIKDYKSDDDADAVVKLSSVNPDEVEITDEAALKFKVKTRASHNARAAMKCYRADVVDPTATPPYRNTGLFGPYEVVDV